MTKISRQIHIKAKPEKVLEYIADVEHHPAFISALKSVEELTGDPRQQTTGWNWSFTMLGVELKGQGTTIAYQPGKDYSFKTMGGITSTFSYSVEPENDGTKLMIDVEYDAPQAVLSKVADSGVVERFGETEADRAAESLKAILEG